MVEVSNELIYQLTLEIQAEQKAARLRTDAGFEKLTQSVGTIAESMVSLRKQVQHLADRMDKMTTNMRMASLAVDQHTARLDRIEARLDHHDAE